MEASTLLGKKDTSTFTINIPQGYSPPRASISFFPDSANLFTEFTFDASGSKDDEDSLAQLEFRWDFDGDLNWDTDFSAEALVKHKYDDNESYQVVLEVKDPQDMRSQITKTLIVTRLNDQIVPSMDYECWPCTLEDTIKFDASGSYVKDIPDAQLSYSWDILNDGRWEVENSPSPYYEYQIPVDGIHKIRLRVVDSDGLYMDSIYSIEIFPYNTPPKVFLILGNRYGNTSTDFYVHGRGSWDRESSYLDLKVRWDMNDDGVWDEEYNDKFEAWLNFDSPGEYPIVLSVIDTEDKSTTVYDTISVFHGDRETDILEDRRDTWIPEYYGIIKIGNTWWTQNNSRYVPPQGFPLPPDSYLVDSYMGQIDSVYKYGYLYPYRAITSDFSPCPKGWRIPSIEDWEQLMVDLGPDVKYSDLLLGGPSELHLHLTGQYDVNGYNSKGRMVHYYTPNTTPQGHVYLWYIDKLLNKNKKVLASRMYNLPMRCVKLGN